MTAQEEEDKGAYGCTGRNNGKGDSVRKGLGIVAVRSKRMIKRIEREAVESCGKKMEV